MSVVRPTDPKDLKEMAIVFATLLTSRSAVPISPEWFKGGGDLGEFGLLLERKVFESIMAVSGPDRWNGTVGYLHNAEAAVKLIAQELFEGDSLFEGDERIGEEIVGHGLGTQMVTRQMLRDMQTIWCFLRHGDIEGSRPTNGFLQFTMLSAGPDTCFQSCAPEVLESDVRLSRSLYPSCHQQIFAVCALLSREVGKVQEGNLLHRFSPESNFAKSNNPLLRAFAKAASEIFQPNP